MILPLTSKDLQDIILSKMNTGELITIIIIIIISLSKMLRQVQNEMFTFEIDSENALVGCTLER